MGSCLQQDYLQRWPSKPCPRSAGVIQWMLTSPYRGTVLWAERLLWTQLSFQEVGLHKNRLQILSIGVFAVLLSCSSILGGRRSKLTVSELALRLPWTVFMVFCHSSLEGHCCKPSRVICSAGALRAAGSANAVTQACASCTASSRLVKPLHMRTALSLLVLGLTQAGKRR